MSSSNPLLVIMALNFSMRPESPNRADEKILQEHNYSMLILIALLSVVVMRTQTDSSDDSFLKEHIFLL